MHPGAQQFRFSCFGRRYVASLGRSSRLDPDARSDALARLREALFSYRAGDPETLHAVEAVHQALTTSFAPASRLGSFAPLRPPLERAERIGRDLEAAVHSGRLQITLEERPIVRMARTLSAQAPPGPASTSEEEPTFFEAAFVDEIGEGIAGIEVVLTVAGEKHELTSDGSGKVRVDGVFATSFASVRVVNVDAVRDALRPRWDTIRDGPLLEPDENGTVVFLRGDSIDGFAITSETLFTVSIQPYVVQARLLGMFFDTNKTFLLPTALPSIKQVKRLYDQNPQSHLLLVGHTDTSGEPGINDPLSLERADSLSAFLTDDVDVWLEMYDSGLPFSKRWGAREDLLMLQSLPDFVDKPVSEDPIHWFQRTRGLQLDGIAGPQTRTQLVTEYMSHDGTTLPQGVPLTGHGCGENFPLDDTATALDENPETNKRDQVDRRVELFFFDKSLGVQPPPPGANSLAGSREYPEWRRRSRETQDFNAGPIELDFGKIHMQIVQHLDHAPIAAASYRLSSDAGAVFEGHTDGEGVLLHPLVPPGHYTLAMDGLSQVFEALVLEPDDPELQVRFAT